MEIIEQKRREKVLYRFCNHLKLLLLSMFCFSGGILGSDDVRTTCIFCERSYKISWKYCQLSWKLEFYLCLIRMCFKNKNNILKEFYKFFVRRCEMWCFIIDCFAISLMMTRCEWWGPSFISWLIPELYLLPENTYSEYRIRPRNIL